MLLHRLQQRRLGPRAGAVDFVGHQKLGEDRSLDEAKTAPPGFALLHHLGAEDVRRHQIRGELDPLVVEPENRAEGFHQLGLAEPGESDEQSVTAREKGDKGLFDNLLLAEDHPADAVAHHRHAVAERLDLGRAGRPLGGGRVVD